ncbi:MAG TPA: hypothetical protein VGV61_14065, partial [Thermoanaerobaculia bacterium]|nr:hypothetical protein [Thermoanaerobaculia bacterium]
MTKPLDQLTPADFQALVGERFTVVQNEGDLALELVEVRALPPHSRRAEPFALLFRGPRQPALSQRIHTLATGRVGQLTLF